MDRVTAEVSNEVKEPRSRSIWVYLVVSFFALCYGVAKLPDHAPPPPAFLFADRTCITGSWKVFLIAAHLLAFVLIPIAMKVFQMSLAAMRFPRASIFAAQLGLAFLMVAIAFDTAWHVTQCWYYTTQYTALSFLYYFFLLSAYFLWSDAMVASPSSTDIIFNYVCAALLLLIALLYPSAASTGNGLYELPVYILYTLIFAVLTYRGYKLLNSWTIAIFTFFSFFVFLLSLWLLNGAGGNQFSDPQPGANALYHFAHHLLGVELGIVIITLLLYTKGQQAKRRDGVEEPLLGN